MRPRGMVRAMVSVGTCGALAAVLPTARVVAASRPAPTHAYVVFFRLADRGRPDGRALERANLQSEVAFLASIGVTTVARTVVPETATVHADAEQLQLLRSNATVAHIFPNSTIKMLQPEQVALHVHATPSASAASADPGSAICGTAASPELDPQALTSIDAEPAIQAGWDGAGVKVGFIADGIDTTLGGFERSAQFASSGSPAGSPVIATYRDFSQDGTTAQTAGAESFLDASSIAAQGSSTFDLSAYMVPSHPLPPGCDVRIQGDAPGATLEALKAFSAEGFTTTSNIVEAINYAVESHVQVLNESFGSNGFPDTALDAIRIADEEATEAGVTVVASSGDGGVNSTIADPSSDPRVISVGATTTFRAYQQDTFGGINVPGVGNGMVANDNISSISSGGFAQNGKTVDLVAPGDLNWALCSTSPTYSDCAGAPLELAGGTSESAPLVAGAAADVIEAFAATHGGAVPSPGLVAHILTSSARDVDAPGVEQGAGLLDVAAAVALARSIGGSSAGHSGGGLLASASQLDLAGMPGATATGTVAITNTGSTPVQITPMVRGLVATSSATGSVTMNPLLQASQPRFTNWAGIQETYQLATFQVPSGTDRLTLDDAYLDTGQSSVVHVALFDGGGTYEGYSLPQGGGDYGSIEVANPPPGTWTAAFFTEWDGETVGTGTSGAVPWTATFWRWHVGGSTGPRSAAIPPGATQRVTVRLPTGEAPGDAGYSLVVGNGMTIPVTLRTMVRLTASGALFSGVLTGGNGRNAPGATSAPAQTDTYVFDVPAREVAIDIAVLMDGNRGAGAIPGDELNAYLVDPAGNTVAYDSSYTVNGDFKAEATPVVGLYKARPSPGRYELLLEWAQPVSGRAVANPFTVGISFDNVPVGATVPDSPRTVIPRMSAVSYEVTVHNTTGAPMLLSTDARLHRRVRFRLPDFFQEQPIQTVPGAVNTYYVPTETASVCLRVTAPIPVTFDFSWEPGDPDLSPQTVGPGVSGVGPGRVAAVTYAPPGGVSPGLWSDLVAAVGPYGTTGQRYRSEQTVAFVTTRAFDRAVSSPTGDVVREMAEIGGSANLSPDVVGAGKWLQIPVTIRPTARVGTRVSGTLFLDGLAGATFVSTLDGTEPFASEIAAIPYAYTVGPAVSASR